MSTITETVREIALNQPSSIPVFERFGIDYCCGGREPLAVACTERGVEIDAVLTALAQAAAEPAPEQTDWSKQSLASLSRHIVSHHHEYVREALPQLDALAKKVLAAHGPNHSELPELQYTLNQLDNELTRHQFKEEMIVFPYIEQLERSMAGNGPRPHGCFSTVQSPVDRMVCEHDSAGELLAEMRELTGNYTVPPDACPTFHAFYNSLKDFERDLHMHIHLENNILFPRAIELEASASR
jgi:regulator of cell morphogenesis and NO signaling